MAREGLQLDLASAMRQAAAQDMGVLHRGVRVRTNGESILVDVRVTRVPEPEPLRGLFVIGLENPPPMPPKQTTETTEEAEPPSRDAVAELQYTKESHQRTVEELETANEELKSTNEELQGKVEELSRANDDIVLPTTSSRACKCRCWCSTGSSGCYRRIPRFARLSPFPRPNR
jgi:two-component system CheB/CheR fusion protein